jgi:hypothetical protein
MANVNKIDKAFVCRIVELHGRGLPQRRAALAFLAFAAGRPLDD